MELQIKVNGNDFTQGISHYEPGSVVSASIPQKIYEKYGGIYVFKSQIENYMPDYKTIERMNGAIIDLGILSSLYQRNIENSQIIIEKNSVYHFLFPYENFLDLSVIKSTPTVLTDRPSIDQFQLIMLYSSGFKPEDVAGTRGKIFYNPKIMKTNDDKSKDFFYAGIQVGNVVANISTQGPYQVFYSFNTGNKNNDFNCIAGPEHMASEIRRMRAN